MTMMCFPSRELTCNISHSKGALFEDDFPFPRVGYVSSPGGTTYDYDP